MQLNEISISSTPHAITADWEFVEQELMKRGLEEGSLTEVLDLSQVRTKKILDTEQVINELDVLGRRHRDDILHDAVQKFAARLSKDAAVRRARET